MMLILLKNLQSQNNQSKKKKRQKLLKMQLYFLMKGKTFSMPLKVEYFQKKKKNKEKDLQVFYTAQLVQLARKVPHCKVSDRRQFKVLTPDQLLQRLPIALVQVKASNTSEKLLNQIRQII